MIDEEINNLYVPMCIKIMRKYLTPEGKDKKSSIELDSEILQIENRLKLNSRARLRFRKLLFPLDEELNNMSIERDFPSPSPQKLKTNTSVSCTKKRKKVISGDDKKSPVGNKYLTQKTLTLKNTYNLRSKKDKNISLKKKKKMKNTLSQETIPNMFSGNSTIFQTSKASVANSIELKSIACISLTKR